MMMASGALWGLAPGAAPGQGLGGQPKPVDLFVSGTEGYHTFRIPAIVRAAEHDLLAFAEGRKGGQGDAGDIDLVMRRSTDGGRTWGPLLVVWDDGANTCGNPCPVADRETGAVLLLATHNLGTDSEREIIEQTAEGTRTVWVLQSTDDGLSWGAPRNITEQAKAIDWTWYATGPGNGIQLRWGDHAGRLVVPCDHIVEGTKQYFSHVIVSDDHGATWRLGGTTPTDKVNECAVAEIGPDRLLLNMRNSDRSVHARALSESDDAGETWGELRRDEGLPEPICQAAMIAMHAGRERSAEFSGPPMLVFSNPASASARERMTLRVSGDGGRSWNELEVLHPGPSAYSSLVDLGGGAVGCLYECGDKNPYERITFATAPVWSDGAPPAGSPPASPR